VPSNGPLGWESDIIGNQIDLLPTIIDLLDIKHEEPIQGRSLFDGRIRNRVSFIYTDYYQHLVNGLAHRICGANDLVQVSTVPSNGDYSEVNCLHDERRLCRSIMEKIDQFDKNQNQRLLRLIH